MIRLDTAAKHGVDRRAHLIKIRASQLNHCAFCLDMHTKDALAAGESAERIIQLNAWAESKHFDTAKDIAAIELTEAITCSRTDSSPTRSTHGSRRVRRHRAGPPHRAITAINAWNRFGVSTRMAPGHYTPGA